MSVEAFSNLPFAVGSAVAATAGRAAMAAVRAYMHAPLRNTAIAGLVTLSAMAGSNALYKQAHHHPAPMFGSFETKPKAVKAKVEPVVPASRPTKFDVLPTPETTGSVDPAGTATGPIGNADVLEVQRKLKAFELFDGKVDGLFGPRTSKAIRAFEQKLGLEPTGQLTPEIVDRIRSTPIFAEPQKVEAAPLAAEPAGETVVKSSPAPLAMIEESKPLPAPAPLAAIAEVEQAPAQIEQAPMAEVEPAPVAETKAEDGQQVAALEAPADTIATLSMTPTPSVTKRAVKTIAVRAATPAPAQTMPALLEDAAPTANVATDPATVAAVQRGLASLGFLHGDADGVAGEATAKAIRNFEVYFNYDVTGRISRELVNLLVQNGAVI
jgi:peptidoglycan hydrolase-like protein with peptidoglycan-binding domain